MKEQLEDNRKSSAENERRATATLAAIEKQATAIENQLVVLRDAGLHTKQAADAATKNAEVAQQTLWMTQRADILVDSASVVSPQNLVTSIWGISKVILMFKNFGHTRAEKVIFKISLEIDGVATSDAPPGEYLIGPGDTFPLTFNPFGKWLNEATVMQLRCGEKKLGFSGTVSYNDIFGRSHVHSTTGNYDVSNSDFTIERHEGT